MANSARPWSGRGRADAKRAEGDGAATVGNIEYGKRRRPCDAPERLRLPPSSSAGAVTPTGGCLPVFRFALRRRRRGLREARFRPGVGGSWGPQRPRRDGAPLLAGGGGGGNYGVLPPARRWGAAAPLQDFRSSAAAAPDQAQPNRRPSCPEIVVRIPRLPEERAGNVRLISRGGSCRRCRMPLALTWRLRPGLFS